MIGSPTTLTTSGQSSHHFGTSSSIKNDTASLQPVIADLCMRQNIIYKCCGITGHKSYSCILCGPKFLPPSLMINMNQFNAPNGEEPNETPIEWNGQPPAAHFKYRTSPPKTSPVVSAIMGRLDHNSINYGDVQLNLTLNLFQIQTPLRSNQFMIIKCTISWNSSTRNMMMILWMLKSRYFRIDW